MPKQQGPEEALRREVGDPVQAGNGANPPQAVAAERLGGVQGQWQISCTPGHSWPLRRMPAHGCSSGTTET